MKKIKAILLNTIMSLGLLVPNTKATEKPEGPDFAALEQKFPKHFAGFSAASPELIQALRQLNKKGKDQHLPRRPFEILSTELGKHEERFGDIKRGVDQLLASSTQFSLQQYLLCLARVVYSGVKATTEEEQFFKGAGFSSLYSIVTCADFQKGFSTLEEFLLLIAEGDYNKIDNRGDFDRPTHRYYPQQKVEVDDEYVNKGPFKTTKVPLVGSDILGFFFLALTYARGDHPVPVPLKDTQDELHGIPMSRWGKVCHDIAHADLDSADYNAEQFINYLLNYHTQLVRSNAEFMTQEDRKKFSLPAMLPHFAKFGMALHANYMQARTDILNLSLVEMNPLDPQNLASFEAFSVAAAVRIHERPEDLSRRYGTQNLKDLLTPESKEPVKEPVKEEGQEKKKDELPPRQNLFQTSYITGDSPLSDERIFDLVKVREASEFLTHFDFIKQNKIVEHNIAEYEVRRNKFYIEVSITMVDGGEFLYRQETNYSRRLNFKHDLAFLEPAEAILKFNYGYELPKIPQDEQMGEEAFENAVKETAQSLEKGWDHLLDFWQKQAIRLSEIRTQADKPSIAERFATAYKIAFEDLQAVLTPFYGEGDQAYDLAHHMKMALDSDVLNFKMIPTLKRPAQVVPVTSDANHGN